MAHGVVDQVDQSTLQERTVSQQQLFLVRGLGIQPHALGPGLGPDGVGGLDQQVAGVHQLALERGRLRPGQADVGVGQGQGALGQ